MFPTPAPGSAPQAHPQHSITPCSPHSCYTLSFTQYCHNTVLLHSPPSSCCIISQSILSETLNHPHSLSIWWHSLTEVAFLRRVHASSRIQHSTCLCNFLIKILRLSTHSLHISLISNSTFKIEN